MGQTSPDWRKEWYEIDDATYLNMASRGPMPRAVLRAVQDSFDAHRFPHGINEGMFFDVPNRLRASLTTMIGAKPSEIALTTGASTGMVAVALSIDWKPGDEVITATDEFPLQHAT